jgi:Cu(I)/Ag(I) efflux system membrane protein CusA/SilA
MAGATIIAVTLVPVLCTFLLGGKVHSEQSNPVMRFLRRLYEPTLILALKHRVIAICVALALFIGAIVLAMGIGSEFMPPLNEGDVMFMPVTDPAISIDEATKIMSKQGELLKSFPEVDMAVGKAGRAETSTDPAPTNMNETLIHLKPQDEWRPGVTREDLITEMDEKLRMPGVTNIWTQPIINRIEMLSTGIRTQVGIKIFGNDLKQLETLSRQVAESVKKVRGAVDVYPEQIGGSPYIDIKINRPAAARYGIDVAVIQDTIEKGIGETNLSVTVEGRRRFPVRVRYAKAFRDTPEALGQIPIAMSNGGTVPLSQVADIKSVEGATMIQSENGLLRGTVLLNVRGRDVGSFVDEAKEKIKEVELPPGYYVAWSGQYENQQRAKSRLLFVVPIVMLIIFGLLYLTYHSVIEAAHVLMAVPFALTGGVYLVWFLGYNFSVAVWVGFIALFGTAVQTAVVMVIYLNESVHNKRDELGRHLTKKELMQAVIDGALLRLRPKVMTVSTVIAGLLPIMWSSSAGSEVMKPLAAPVLGGMVSSLLHVLIITPVIFYWLRERELRKEKIINEIEKH